MMEELDHNKAQAKNVFMDKHNSVVVENFDLNRLMTSKDKTNDIEYINILEIVKLIDRILFNDFEEA